MRYFVIALCVLTSFTIKLNAQISQGGIPAGFKFAPDGRLNAEQMPAVDVPALLAEDSVNERNNSAPYRFGFNHMVNFSLSNSGLWTTLNNGDRIWQIDVKSAGAYSINLAFSNFHLPKGAKLFVYSKNHLQVLGAFTEKDNHDDKFFGTELINGNEVVVEYFEPAGVAGQGTFTLFRITHGYKDLNKFLKSFGDAGACTNNINCPQYSAWATQKRSVVCLVSGGNEFCSGALINNTLNNGTPYVLTANHCGTADGTWIFRFNWEAPGCTNPTTSPSTAQSISGGTPVAHNAVSDFNLVRMGGTPPTAFNAFYAGWNRSTIAATNVTGIHHPNGDIKKCSQAANAVTATSADEGNGAAQVWQIGQWTDGVTEPGSSGSPLFDQNKRIIGQLYGGPSYCGASTANLKDVYGRFCVSWDTGSTSASRLHDWLDPNNSGAITNDGFDPNAPTLALDAALSAIGAPSGSSCNSNVAPVVTLNNHGLDTLRSVTINFHTDNGTNSIYSWTGVLPTSASTDVTLPAFTSTGGTHTFYVTITSPNGGADQNTSNDSINQQFTIIVPVPVALPFIEGFTSATFPPTGWTINNADGDNTWLRSNTVGGFGQSTNSAYIDQFSPNSSTQDELDDMVTPYIDFSTATGPVYFSFDVANARYNTQLYDSLIVLGSSDCGITWSRLYAKGSTSLVTAPNKTSLFVPTSTQWRRDTINVSSFAGQSAVQFSIELKSGWANATYIDNINISSPAVNALDAGLNNLTVPADAVCDPSFQPTFTITNNGSTILTTDTIQYKLDNGSVQNYVWSGSLATAASATVILPSLSPAVGSHNISIFSNSPNGGLDGNHTNDTLNKTFTVGVTPTVTLQLPQDTLCSNAGTVTLTGGSPTGGVYSGTNVTAGAFDAAAAGTGSHVITYAYTSNGCSANATQNLVVQVCTGLNDIDADMAMQVYPNPFNDGLTLKFNLSEARNIDAGLYAIDGKLVSKLLTAEKMAAGDHELQIAANDLSNGVYFLKLNNRYIKLEKIR